MTQPEHLHKHTSLIKYGEGTALSSSTNNGSSGSYEGYESFSLNFLDLFFYIELYTCNDEITLILYILN